MYVIVWLLSPERVLEAAVACLRTFIAVGRQVTNLLVSLGVAYPLRVHVSADDLLSLLKVSFIFLIPERASSPS